jgi:hypothetical protein
MMARTLVVQAHLKDAIRVGGQAQVPMGLERRNGIAN